MAKQKIATKTGAIVVFLDWDNTMNRFGSYISRIIHKVADQMRKACLIDEEKYQDIRSKIPLIPTKSRDETLKEIFGVQGHLNQEALRRIKILKRNEPFKPRGLPGSQQTIEFLYQENQKGHLHFCILSNKMTKDLKEEIRQLKWGKYVRDIPVIGGDMSSGVKPDPRHALVGLGMLSGKLEKYSKVELIFIGDGLNSDITIARRFNREITPLYIRECSAHAVLFNVFYDNTYQPKKIYSPSEYKNFIDDQTILNQEDIVFGHSALRLRLAHYIGNCISNDRSKGNNSFSHDANYEGAVRRSGAPSRL